ncbi:hypothetical protein [[Mycoplasma] collis]|nr:hypothetical protein [[Mycoplasma] collis]
MWLKILNFLLDLSLIIKSIIHNKQIEIGKKFNLELISLVQ